MRRRKRDGLQANQGRVRGRGQEIEWNSGRRGRAICAVVSKVHRIPDKRICATGRETTDKVEGEGGELLTTDRVYFFNANLAKDSQDRVEDLEGVGSRGVESCCVRKKCGGKSIGGRVYVDFNLASSGWPELFTWGKDDVLAPS